MAIRYTPIREMPVSAGRKGPRESSCRRAYEAARASESGVIQVEGESPEELEQFYKSMVQWRHRHKDVPIVVKKDGPVVFIMVRREEQADD